MRLVAFEILVLFFTHVTSDQSRLYVCVFVCISAAERRYAD